MIWDHLLVVHVIPAPETGNAKHMLAARDVADFALTAASSGKRRIALLIALRIHDGSLPR
jgi:hypothetical protein